MADMMVTKGLVDNTAAQIDFLLTRLRKASERFDEMLPDGFRFGKCPDLAGVIRGLTDFTAKVDAEVGAAEIDARFGPSRKTKRRASLAPEVKPSRKAKVGK